MNLKIKLIKHKWVLFCIIGASVMGIVTYSLPIAEGDDILYLLSSISQGLAAIFALVFTITIFGAQMMQKFTALDRVIDGWTKGLMILFAIGILLPLLQLKTDYDALNLNLVDTANLSLAIDLSIATFCVLAVIPYLIRVNKTMKYEGGISKLSEELAMAVDSNHKATSLNRVSELLELGKSAADDVMENETIKIVKNLKDMGVEVTEKGWGDIAREIVYALKEIGLKNADKNLDGATREVLEALRKIGIKAADKVADEKLVNDVIINAVVGLREIGIGAIDNDLSDGTVLDSTYGLYDIGSKGVEKKLGLFHSADLIIVPVIEKENLIKVLLEIANKAYEKNEKKFKNASENSMMYLWALGAYVKKYLPQYAEEMALQLNKSNKRVIRELFGHQDIRERAMNWVPAPLKDALKAFEDLYDKSDYIQP